MNGNIRKTLSNHSCNSLYGFRSKPRVDTVEKSVVKEPSVFKHIDVSILVTSRII